MTGLFESNRHISQLTVSSLSSYYSIKKIQMYKIKIIVDLNIILLLSRWIIL